MSGRNLDRAAARCGQAIITGAHPETIKELERVVTKTLGVLQEDGVYAALLYLSSRPKSELPVAKTIRTELLRLLRDDLAGFPTGITPTFDIATAAWPAISTALIAEPGLLSDLGTLFLVKELFEQALIYARFGAKAAQPAQPAPAGGRPR